MIVLSLFDGIACAYEALKKAGIKIDKYYASEVDKYAVAVSKLQHPDIIHLGDVRNVVPGTITEKVDLLIGGSPCFVAGTKVLTDKGYKNIEDVAVGDRVLTHKRRFKKVLRVGSRMAETYTLKIQGVLEIETTKNHPFYVREMKRVFNRERKAHERTWSEPFWKQAGDLACNDFVGIPILDIEENPLNLSEEDCWLIGRYIADGHIRKTKRKGRKNSYQYQVVYSVGSHKLDEFSANVKRHFTCHLHTQSTHRCIVNSKDFLELLESLEVGKGALYKQISLPLLLLPKCLLKKVIEGYLSGDGSYNNKKRLYRAGTISEKLALSLQLAVAKVYGVNSSIYFSKTANKHIIEGREVNQHDIYEVHFSPAYKKQRHAKVIDGIVWVPVKEIKKTEETKRVYNLEVEEDNSYTANNVIVHNCQDLSISKRERAGLKGERSALFWEYLRVFKIYKPKYFILENVASMKKADRDTITQMLGVEPIMINSALVSAQQRKRLYWTNIKVKGLPEDKGILLKDILETGYTEREKALCVTATYARTVPQDYFYSKARQMVFNKPVRVGTIGKGGQGERIYSIDGKSICLSANGGGRGAKTGLYLIKDYVRKLSPVECERLQTLPDNYTALGCFDGEIRKISNTQRYKMLGNSFTVDVIAWILSFIRRKR